jgi:hypothetical protein
VLNKAGVCVAEHVREVVEIPHLAQELLSSDRTPTLAFSLPVYDRIITQWESKQSKFPLLFTPIQVGITKFKEYIAKTCESQVYAFATGTLHCGTTCFPLILPNPSLESVPQTAVDYRQLGGEESVEMVRGWVIEQVGTFSRRNAIITHTFSRCLNSR